MSDKISIPNSIDGDKLAAMRFIASLKEQADKQGVGFIGGFIAPDGQKFIMTNMEDEDQEDFQLPPV